MKYWGCHRLRQSVRSRRGTEPRITAYHPDRNPSLHANAIAALINEAWETLSDAERRKHYDTQIGLGGHSKPNDTKEVRHERKSTTRVARPVASSRTVPRAQTQKTRPTARQSAPTVLSRSAYVLAGLLLGGGAVTFAGLGGDLGTADHSSGFGLLFWVCVAVAMYCLGRAGLRFRWLVFPFVLVCPPLWVLMRLWVRQRPLGPIEQRFIKVLVAVGASGLVFAVAFVSLENEVQHTRALELAGVVVGASWLIWAILRLRHKQDPRQPLSRGSACNVVGKCLNTLRCVGASSSGSRLIARAHDDQRWPASPRADDGSVGRRVTRASAASPTSQPARAVSRRRHAGDAAVPPVSVAQCGASNRCAEGCAYPAAHVLLASADAGRPR